MLTAYGCDAPWLILPHFPIVPPLQTLIPTSEGAQQLRFVMLTPRVANSI
jgi:hypothetical protein